jgi:hypothetical protein
VLRRFPYLVVFRVTTAGGEVIAIAPGCRRQGIGEIEWSEQVAFFSGVIPAAYADNDIDDKTK